MNKKITATILLLCLAFTACSTKEDEQTSVSVTTTVTEATTAATATTTTTTTTTIETTVTETALSSEEESATSMDYDLACEEMNTVNGILRDIHESDEYHNMSQEERLEWYYEVLDELATEGADPYNYPLINGDSITYDEFNNEISFQYNFGGWGFIELDWPLYETGEC